MRSYRRVLEWITFIIALHLMDRFTALALDVVPSSCRQYSDTSVGLRMQHHPIEADREVHHMAIFLASRMMKSFLLRERRGRKRKLDQSETSKLHEQSISQESEQEMPQEFAAFVDLASVQTPNFSITTLQRLDARLPLMCESIYSALGSCESESIYQHVLAVELERSGVKVEKEVKIGILYEGRLVGSRRCDLVLTLVDGSVVVVELKTVVALRRQDVDQMRFYMQHLGIQNGYLVNFPRRKKFPEVADACEDEISFLYEPLCGRPPLEAHQKTPSSQGSYMHAMFDTEIQICKATRFGSLARRDSPRGKDDEFKVPIARSTGLPCKLCARFQDYCDYHAYLRRPVT